MYTLYLFQPRADAPDFLVISADPRAEVLAEWEIDGTTLSEEIETDADLGVYPCDRALRH